MSKQNRLNYLIERPNVVTVNCAGDEMIGVEAFQNVVDLRHGRNVGLVIATVVANVVTPAHMLS